MTYPTTRQTRPVHLRRRIAGVFTVALAALVGLAVTSTAPLAAQSAPVAPKPAIVGSLVRITQPSVTSGRSQRLVGRLLPSDAVYLRIVRQNGDTANVPRQGVTQLEVSTEKPRQVMSAVVLGAFGVGAGGAALAALTDRCAGARA